MSSSSKDSRTKIPSKTDKVQKTTTDVQENEEAIKKISTKEMINKALAESKNRKGLSLYAIKKYMEENFHSDTKKIGHIIRKLLKTGVENGTIVQTKGIGASGSFKLPPVIKRKPQKPENESNEKPSKSKQDGVATNESKKSVKITIEKTSKTTDSDMKSIKKSKDKLKTKGDIPKTPAKKRAKLMKRKSIGSIIKPPKMKPKAVAR